MRFVHTHPQHGSIHPLFLTRCRFVQFSSDDVRHRNAFDALSRGADLWKPINSAMAFSHNQLLDFSELRDDIWRCVYAFRSSCAYLLPSFSACVQREVLPVHSMRRLGCRGCQLRPPM